MVRPTRDAAHRATHASESGPETVASTLDDDFFARRIRLVGDQFNGVKSETLHIGRYQQMPSKVVDDDFLVLIPFWQDSASHQHVSNLMCQGEPLTTCTESPVDYNMLVAKCESAHALVQIPVAPRDPEFVG